MHFILFYFLTLLWLVMHVNSTAFVENLRRFFYKFTDDDETSNKFSEGDVSFDVR